jgi:hypothetical protein
MQAELKAVADALSALSLSFQKLSETYTDEKTPNAAASSVAPAAEPQRKKSARQKAEDFKAQSTVNNADCAKCGFLFNGMCLAKQLPDACELPGKIKAGIIQTACRDNLGNEINLELCKAEGLWKARSAAIGTYIMVEPLLEPDAVIAGLIKQQWCVFSAKPGRVPHGKTCCAFCQKSKGIGTLCTENHLASLSVESCPLWAPIAHCLTADKGYPCIHLQRSGELFQGCDKYPSIAECVKAQKEPKTEATETNESTDW